MTNQNKSAQARQRRRSSDGRFADEDKQDSLPSDTKIQQVASLLTDDTEPDFNQLLTAPGAFDDPYEARHIEFDMPDGSTLNGYALDDGRIDRNKVPAGWHAYSVMESDGDEDGETTLSIDHDGYVNHRMDFITTEDLSQRIDSTVEIALLKLLTARSVILRPVNRHRYAVLDFIINSFRGSGTVNIIPPVIPNQPLRIRLRKLREQRTQILTGACLVKPHNFTDPDCAPCLSLLPERLLRPPKPKLLNLLCHPRPHSVPPPLRKIFPPYCLCTGLMHHFSSGCSISFSLASSLSLSSPRERFRESASFWRQLSLREIP